MLHQWIVFLICLCVPLVEMFGPMPKPPSMPKYDEIKHDAIDMKDKAVESKSELDAADVTEQQFYECFADINCELGDSVRGELFDCWHINTKEELDEYVQLFGTSPVGNFTRLTIEHVNEDFCVLDDYDQRKINDHFAIEAAERLKTYCGGIKSRARCKRLRETSQCVMTLMEKSIATGQCKTIVADVEGMAPMKPMDVAHKFM